MKRLVAIGLLFIGFVCVAQTEIPAFPSAEGGGQYATGGRGGYVYFVNTLQDNDTGNKSTGEGTLRWCLAQTGPRTIIFRVGGIIHLKSTLGIPANTTIAGQTAPGDGICIADYSVKVNGNNVIIRYMRFRMGDVTAQESDALWGRNLSNVIIDHCSMSWSTDECASFYDNTNFTLQWSILSESLRASVHDKGNHGYGGIWGGKTATFHHNLLAHHDSRNPRMCGSRYSNKPDLELVDFRNNVIYNWGSNSGYAGEGGHYNFVNNYYKPGPTSSNPTRIFQPYPDDGKNAQPLNVWGVFYVSGNYMDGSPTVTNDNWLGIHPSPTNKKKEELKSDIEFEVPKVKTQTAEEAYLSVLEKGGASFHRDSTDARIINEVANKLAPVRASNGTTKGGLIDSQADVGGWEVYAYDSTSVPLDIDLDGIADEWELQNGLNPADKEDRNDINSFGYTMLEAYLYDLLGEVPEEVIVNNVSIEKINLNARVFPNPANHLTELHFTLEKSCNVKAELISLNGEVVGKILNGYFEQGYHHEQFDVSQLQQGLYFCKITTGAIAKTIKIAVKQ